LLPVRSPVDDTREPSNQKLAPDAFSMRVRALRRIPPSVGLCVELSNRVSESARKLFVSAAHASVALPIEGPGRVELASRPAELEFYH
jgi:hypothetical protein